MTRKSVDSIHAQSEEEGREMVVHVGAILLCIAAIFLVPGVLPCLPRSAMLAARKSMLVKGVGCGEDEGMRPRLHEGLLLRGEIGHATVVGSGLGNQVAGILRNEARIGICILSREGGGKLTEEMGCGTRILRLRGCGAEIMGEDSDDDAIGAVSEGSASMGTSSVGSHHGGVGDAAAASDEDDDDGKFLDPEDLKVPMDEDEENAEEEGKEEEEEEEVKKKKVKKKKKKKKGTILEEKEEEKEKEEVGVLGDISSAGKEEWDEEESGEGKIYDDGASDDLKSSSHAKEVGRSELVDDEGGVTKESPSRKREAGSAKELNRSGEKVQGRKDKWPQGSSAVSKEGAVVVESFDDCVIGGGLSMDKERKRIQAVEEVLRPAHEWGLEGDEAWMDPEEKTDPRLIEIPSYAMFGARGRGGISTYHLLVETCHDGNLFIGCVEPHFDVTFENWPNCIKERAWMLCDGGTAFRTGPDSGGPDYYPDGDDPMFTENPMQYVAKKVGYEILTGLLKREMYEEHPEVTTPGVWGIKEGAVVTMTLDRERGELTFEVADTPPFTLYNVSKNARPFISMMYLNDTISVLSPDEAQSARRRFTAMQRSPSDPDYWLWDYERWRPADGGLYWKNGELVEDKTKKNRWFPKIDLKDGRSPVPGLSLIEYIQRRNAFNKEKADRRRRERERVARRAAERGDEPPAKWQYRPGVQRAASEQGGDAGGIVQVTDDNLGDVMERAREAERKGGGVMDAAKLFEIESSDAQEEEEEEDEEGRGIDESGSSSSP